MKTLNEVTKTMTTNNYRLRGTHYDASGYLRDNISHCYEVLVIDGRAYQADLGDVPAEFARAVLDEYGTLPVGTAGCYFIPVEGEFDRVGRDLFEA